MLADLVYAGATRLVQLTHADGTIWSAPGWDQAGRRSLAKVTRPYGGSDPEGGLVFSEELRHDVRDAVSAVIWARGRCGVDVSEAQTYTFDDAGRLKEFTQGLWSAATGTVTGSPTARHDYTLDEQSNWREHQGRAGSARLSPSVSSINAYTNWPTDIDGNGTAEFKNPAPDDENRSIDGQLGFVWKKEEREVFRADEDNPKRTMKHVHDGLGRLVEVLKDGVSQVRYGYTADGRLAWRREVAAGRTVWYVHDGRQVIQEIQTAPSTVLVQEYCWQETTLLETRKPGGWIRTLHQDRLGSVVAATAGGGGTVTIEARTAYDPYGRPVSLPSWSAAGVESIVPFGYTGARWEDLAALDVDVDADGTVECVGLYAMGARWYDAEMGRFLEQDPLGEVAGSNLYAYVDASPVMWVDPSGLMREDVRRYANIGSRRFSSTSTRTSTWYSRPESASRIARAGEFLAADILLQFDPLMADRTGKDKKGTGDTDDPRWEGEELIAFGKLKVRVKIGDVLIIRSRKGGFHTATFAGLGENGEIFVFDNTDDRNRKILDNMEKSNPDNRGNVHEKHDITAPTANGKENPYSPENAAVLAGIHRAASSITLEELEGAAKELKMYYNFDGSQCYDYSRALEAATGYTLDPPLPNFMDPWASAFFTPRDTW